MNRSLVSLFSIVLLGTLFTGCAKLSALIPNTYIGNGAIISDTRNVQEFQSVEFDGAYDVVLTQAPQTEVRIETDKNLLDHIKTSVSGGKLTVECEGNLEPSKGITVYISSPNYRSIESDGSSEIRGTTPITSPDLSLALDGSGSYQLNVSAKELKSTIAGAGTVTLSGTAQDYSMEIDGSGDVRTDSLVVNTAHIDISGSGDAAVNVLSRLDASISGSGGVRYRGPVTDVHTSISGSGSVNRAQ